MKEAFISELQQLGLSIPEAQIYIALLSNGSLGATAVANVTGLQRSNVYPILWSLADKGLVEAGSGYGSKFTAVLPDEALPSLVLRERETLAQRERMASQLGQRMASFVNSTEAAPEELIQVIRHPKVIAERFERLQLDAQQQIDCMIKAPILTARRENPAQQKAQRRGVRYRGLYERAAIDEPAVKPFIEGWIAAGEDARIYDGELPHKLVIFDTEVVLLPLIMPGNQTRTLVIRHQQLAKSLRMLFETLWEQAEPIASALRKGTGRTKGVKIIQGKARTIKVDRNGSPRRAS